MGFITDAEEGMRDLIIANISGFTSDNCKITDHAVFNYVQTTSGIDKCCIVEYAGTEGVRNSEFRSSTTETEILVNAFFEVANDTAYVSAIASVKSFIEELIEVVSQTPRLGKSTIMGSRFNMAMQPLEYQRTDRYIYMMASVTFDVFSNIS